MASKQSTTAAETWKPVVGYEGSYEVSDHGRVRSLDRVVAVSASPKKAAYFIGRVGVTLTLSRDSNAPYISVKMAGARILVHTLVLSAFVGACPAGMECRHKDGNPQNNQLSNLVWGTPKDNARDRDAHGTTVRGADSPNAKLSASDIHAIFRLRRDGRTQLSIAGAYGVAQPTISRILSGKAWVTV